MDKNDDKRQQLIARMFSGDCAMRSGEDQVVPWRKLATHLSPLIGETGLSALYGRTLRLQQPHYSWLTTEQSVQSLDSLFNHLESRLSSVDQALAEEANMALLNTFSKLLSGLIGEALTVRLLHSAWGDEPHQGNAKEQK
jgi:hypothetical protein